MKQRITILIMLIALAFSVSASTIVKDTFQKSYHIDASNYPYDSCNVQANWESGSCSYLYACGVVVPKGSTSLADAVVKECKDITDINQGDVTITFIPPRGNRYAVTTFLVEMKETYDTSTYSWNEEILIPLDYRSAEEAISLCADGMMLKDNLCFNAQPVCLDTYSTNLCDNPYSLFVLDYGLGFELDNPAHYCADRDEDLICDETVSYLCADTNENGVCDEDDVSIQGTSCVDANQNYVCDNVESEGTFCRTIFEPVHSGSGTGCITFPNSCFAEASGYVSLAEGTCEPVYGNFCFSNGDCTSPCDGVSGICKNPDGLGNRCFYTGECNPRKIQCTVNSDCPKSPCAGVDVQCTAQNTCEFVGKCISKPTVDPSWWDKIWTVIKYWVAGIFT